MITNLTFLRFLLPALVLVLASCGFLARGGPEGTLDTFLDAWSQAKAAEAAALCESDVATSLERKGINHLTGGMMESHHGSTVTITERSEEGDTVTIEADQVVLFNPTGVHSAMRATMKAVFHHRVTMRKGSEGWKVTGFEPALVSTGEV